MEREKTQKEMSMVHCVNCKHLVKSNDQLPTTPGSNAGVVPPVRGIQAKFNQGMHREPPHSQVDDVSTPASSDSKI